MRNLHENFHTHTASLTRPCLGDSIVDRAKREMSASVTVFACGRARAVIRRRLTCPPRLRLLLLGRVDCGPIYIYIYSYFGLRYNYKMYNLHYLI